MNIEEKHESEKLIVLQPLPAFPFLLLAAICFGKSSEKLDKWFKTPSSTKTILKAL